MMTVRSVVVGLVTLIAVSAAGEGEKWRSLFNGQDLSGWKIKFKGCELGVNYNDTYRVEDGLLKVCYDKYESFSGRFGHIFFEEPFGNYRLRVEYRFVGEQCPGGPGWALRNNGIMIHGQSPESMEKDQNFPVSIEVQLLGGSGTGKRPTANLCTPGTNVVLDGKLHTRHCTNSKSKTYHGDQWVTVELVVRDNTITHIVNGETVMTYTDPQLDERDRDAQRLLKAGHEPMLRSGTISLQAESHPCEFRKIEILELPDAPSSDTPTAAEGWTNLLPGNDLSKYWKTKGNWTIDDDGVVTLTPRPGEQGWSRFDHYLWLDGTYGDFEIVFDYRVHGGGNSGFYFHVGDRTSPVATGIEVQIYESHGKGKNARLTDHDSGGIIPGVPPTKNAAKPAGEWNTFHIVSKGKQLTVVLNGTQVNELSLDHPKIKDRPPTGAIGFQDHALPLALRNIRIRKL